MWVDECVLYVAVGVGGEFYVGWLCGNVLRGLVKGMFLCLC